MAKIYLIYNTENKKKYIGETVNCVSQRFCQHIDAAFRTYHKKNNSFYSEIKDSGERVFDVFKVSILEECEDSERFDKELDYIQKIKPEYNENFKKHYLYKIKDKIIESYKNGKTMDELRIQYKCRQPFISRLLNSSGVETKRSRRNQSKKVYLFDENGKVIKWWVNAGECSQETNIDRSNIRLCCLNNTRENILYFSAENKHFKYTQDTPKDMFEITNKKTGETIKFKSKEALTSYFSKLFPDKKIVYGQIVRDRKSVWGYIVKKLYQHRN